MSFDSVKLRRNDLCPCDSGKKYKKCCLINPRYEGNEETPKDRAATLLGKKRLAEKLKREDITLSPPVDSLPKISGAILDLAKDMLDSASNKSQRKTAVTVACTAWNIAVLIPENRIDEEINHFFEACVYDTEDRGLIREIMRSMIAKKKALYLDDRRLVVDFEVVDTKTFFSVNVAARLPT